MKLRNLFMFGLMFTVVSSLSAIHCQSLQAEAVPAAAVPGAPPAPAPTLRMFPQQGLNNPALTVHQREYREVYELLVRHHPDRTAIAKLKLFEGPIATEDVRDSKIAELVTALGDRWTQYYSTATIAEYERRHARGFVGLGFAVRQRPDGTFGVDYLSWNGSADRGGLRQGDEVISVGGKPLKGLSASAATKLVAEWKVGDKAEVVALHDKVETTYTVEAAAAEANVVSAGVVGSIAYIRVRDFMDANLLPQFARLAPELVTKAGGKIDGIVLDLRGNTGGYMQVAYEFATAFMDKGAIAQTTYRSGRLMQRSVYEAEPFLPDFLEPTEQNKSLMTALQKAPMVVLINRSTMSAAEMLTSALKDSGRATLVGEQTGGKGVSFNTITLSTGARLQLVSGTFTGPTGFDHHNNGIVPHKVFAQPRGNEADKQFAYAVALLTNGRVHPPAQPPGIVPPQAAPGIVKAEPVAAWRLWAVVLFSLAMIVISLRYSLKRRKAQIGSTSRVGRKSAPSSSVEDDDHDLREALRRLSGEDGVNGDSAVHDADGVVVVDWATMLRGEEPPVRHLTSAEPVDSELLVTADSFYLGVACCICDHRATVGDKLTERIDSAGCRVFCAKCSQLK